MYRHSLGQRIGVWLGWNYGQRSLVRRTSYAGGSQELKFNYAESVLAVGLSIAAKQTEEAQLRINIGVAGYYPRSARYDLLEQNSGSSSDVSREFNSPARTGFKAGLRYSRRLTGKLWVVGGPCFALVKPPKEDYIGGSPAGQKYISIGELRTTLGLEIGLEFGPLFKGLTSE